MGDDIAIQRAAGRTRALGFWLCLALVVGNFIGSGIFLLPAQLAPFGWNALFGWLLTVSGGLCLAFVFARLAAIAFPSDSCRLGTRLFLRLRISGLFLNEEHGGEQVVECRRFKMRDLLNTELAFVYGAGSGAGSSPCPPSRGHGSKSKGSKSKGSKGKGTRGKGSR